MKQFLLFLVLIGFALSADRQVDVQMNPQCESCGKNDSTGTYNNLVYVKLTGASDLVHILYSNIDSFTVMLFRTDLDSQLTVDQKKLLSKNATDMLNSISFSKTPIDSCGYSFPIIYEFDDQDGKADMTNPNITGWYLHKTSEMIWNPFKLLDNESGLFEAMQPTSNGSFKVLY